MIAIFWSVDPTFLLSLLRDNYTFCLEARELEQELGEDGGGGGGDGYVGETMVMAMTT